MSVEEVEKLRKRARNNILSAFIFSIGIAFILTYFHISTDIGILSFCASFVISALLCVKSTKNFTLAFKKAFVLKALNYVFTDLIYEPEKGIDSSIIKNTHMINDGNSFSSNDYIEGKYKNIKVIQADVHIEESDSGSDGGPPTTIFMGKWMIFDFNKNFKSNIQVCEKWFPNNTVDKTSYKRIKLEDESFNKLFKTYAQDEHEAFYILTPSLIEKIKKLENSINGKILLCFIDNKLHVGIQNQEDSFEPNVFKKIDADEIIKKVSKDIKLITDFVDELNLDNDLFKMV